MFEDMESAEALTEAAGAADTMVEVVEGDTAEEEAEEATAAEAEEVDTMAEEEATAAEAVEEDIMPEAVEVVTTTMAAVTNRCKTKLSLPFTFKITH